MLLIAPCSLECASAGAEVYFIGLWAEGDMEEGRSGVRRRRLKGSGSPEGLPHTYKSIGRPKQYKKPCCVPKQTCPFATASPLSPKGEFTALRLEYNSRPVNASSA